MAIPRRRRRQCLPARRFRFGYRYDAGRSGLNGGIPEVAARTAEEPGALQQPLPRPFRITVMPKAIDDEGFTGEGAVTCTTATVSMENDDGQSVTDCEVVFGTNYLRNPVAFVPTIPDPEDDGPTLQRTTGLAPAGTTVSAFASYFFENAGSGAELTDVDFHTLTYYDADSIGIFDGILDITVKTAAELAALPYPPPNPFEVNVTVTMTKSAGETAKGSVTYTTE